ncbi:MAG: hypothetical protein LUH15_14825 [Tannerellaceae bacterium]|nr:hypothetical protein [Tannerellaceae bacterium]
MADFNIKEIQSLKLKIQVLEQLTVVGLVTAVIGFYHDWSTLSVFLLIAVCGFQIAKWRFKKKFETERVPGKNG